MKNSTKKQSILKILACSVIIISSGCASTPSSERWKSQLPEGFRVQIELAQAAEEAYHAITDTPIKQLQTEDGSRRVGDLITAARDKYRQWKSYGPYNPNWSNRMSPVKFGSILYYGGRRATGLNCLFHCPRTAGSIKSSRGKSIFWGWDPKDGKHWQPEGPFKAIMEGDDIDDIDSLIGRIKR